MRRWGGEDAPDLPHPLMRSRVPGQFRGFWIEARWLDGRSPNLDRSASPGSADLEPSERLS